MPEKEQGEIQQTAYDRLYYFCVRYLDRFVFAQPGMRDPLQPIDRVFSRELVGVGALLGFLTMLYFFQSEQDKGFVSEMFASVNLYTEQVLHTTDAQEAAQKFFTFGALLYGTAFLERFPDLVRATQRFSSSVANSPLIRHSSAPETEESTFPPEENL
jgi:hypothetical protein